MPEGPTIFLLKEAVQQFNGQNVIAVSGNSKIVQSRLLNNKVISFESWGKHFLISFGEFTVRVHFLMFGTYRINETKESPVRLNITFNNGEINLYSCSVKILEGDVAAQYDFSSDVMSLAWNPKAAERKLKSVSDELVCDALLEQDIFSGVGNIIKNEVLYRIRVHPESTIGRMPATKIKALIEEARTYSFEFLEWKREYDLKKHWLAHTKKICLRCNLPLINRHTGAKDRRSFFCDKCQRLYN